ncbi:outer membrane receptor protein involved in Fe transport [Balneicella halophila]|uniref:Outer membrane receptor protein involved in Fe transport n=1 Tax=Balneicella halophila TaxID=1537566 RepID=A0A7L4URA6_BALHA|nr:TonB-dependent receptor [Balneicella halophila]PVX52283.1 outer membrane receptor protein involved in Fe transport [Balneicella halophila]
MKRNLFLTLLFLTFSSLLVNAAVVEEVIPEDKSVIKGTITDAKTGEPLIGVNVFVPGTVIGGSTDLDGSFFIEIDPGKYTLKMTLIGYEDVTIPDLIVTRGKALNIQQKLIEDSALLGEVVITAKMTRDSEVSAILVQQNSVIMLENVSSDELSRKGISNVEEGLTKVAGITKQATRGIVVRGLGDRYNNVLLNGLPLPSLDPDKKSLPLSMFPTSVINTLSINKSYMGRLYGDFAGATVDIETKNTPRTAFFNIGVSGGMNSYYLSGDDQKLDNTNLTGYLGIDKRRRDLPQYLYALSQLGHYYEDYPYPYLNTSVISNIKGSEIFETKFNPDVRKTPIDFGFSMSGGKTFQLSDAVRLGFVSTANFSSDNDKKEGVQRLLDAQGGVIKDYDFQEWAYNTKLNALLALTLDVNSKHRFTFNNLYLNNSTNSVNEMIGYDDLSGFDLFLRRSKYVQNDLYNGQLLGSHDLDDNEKFFFDWGVSYSFVESDEPDTKDVSMEQTKADSSVYKYKSAPGSNGGRYFGEMEENQYAARAAFRMGFGASPDGEQPYKNYLNVGYNFSARERDFFQILLGFGAKSAFTKDLDYTVDVNDPDSFLNRALDMGAFYYNEIAPDGGRDFEADQTIHAAYLSFEKYFSDKFTAVADVRIEKTDRTMKFVDPTSSVFDPFTELTYDPTDVLPGINFNYKISDETNVRLAGSKTVTRPGIREATNSVYKIPGVGSIFGNSDLVNSTNYNADLKFETFPNRGEMFAVNAFYKRIEDPIERTAEPAAGGRAFTFKNAESATVYGVELEMIKNLGNLFKSETFRPLTFGMNATLMFSEITIPESNGFVTNKERELQGASPYLINADLTYDKKVTDSWTTKATATYNVFGERIYAVGGGGIGDFIEQPQHTIDFIWSNTINHKLSFGFSIKDILDTDFHVEQDGVNEGKDPITGEYNDGMTISFKLGYKF